MTENEAIKYIQRDIYFINKMIEHDKRFDPKADISRYLESKTVYEMAITALKEIGKYNDCKLCLVPADVISKQCCELDEYKGIGTVEECREAVEKRRSKKPVLRNDNGKLRKSCPVCGCFFSPLSRSCPKCGQAIDENLEGMQDE